MFAGEKPGETITTAMPKEGASKSGLAALRQTYRWLRDPKALIGFIPT